jgi:hypothetical protein
VELINKRFLDNFQIIYDNAENIKINAKKEEIII